MPAAPSNASSSRPQVPVEFFLRLCLLIRELHGLPDADYVASNPSALALFRKLRHISAEHGAKRLLAEDREGSLSLLCACVDFASFCGTPISFADIGDAKLENTEWGRDGMKNVSVTWFLMKAIYSMKKCARGVRCDF